MLQFMSYMLQHDEYASYSHLNPAAPRIEDLVTAVYDQFNCLNIEAERSRNGGAATTRLC